MLAIDILLTLLNSNPPEAYFAALGWFIAVTLLSWLFTRYVVGRLEKFATRTPFEFDDTLISIIRNIRPPAYLVLAIYVAVRSLALPDMAYSLAKGALTIVLVYQVVVTLQILFDFVLRRKMQFSSKRDESLESVLGVMSTFSRVILWTLAFLFILSNFGVNVTSLLAGLGIGGIAVALAMQNILSDLFSSLALYIDKPFTVGDSIKVGDIIGTVKHIGIKTTRLKALSGEEVIFSNRELTNAQIRNYRRIGERRVSFDFGVTYNTSEKHLKTLPALIEAAIKTVPKARFGRAHLQSFGESALIFEVVFYVTERDFTTYMTVRQEIHLNLLLAMREAGVTLAFPTRTIHMRTN